jgi:hypothetical protein
MRSIQRRFEKFKKRNPSWSSYTCFAEAVRGQGFDPDRLRRWFNQLVSGDDYSPTDKKAVLAHLEVLNKPLEAYRK